VEDPKVAILSVRMTTAEYAAVVAQAAAAREALGDHVRRRLFVYKNSRRSETVADSP
jgi:hypothetical protein